MLWDVGNERPIWIQKFVSKHLYPVLKQGLCNKAAEVRVEFVAILRVCAQQFAAFAEFKGLDRLLSDDPEIDFFENLRHIQVCTFGLYFVHSLYISFRFVF